MFIACPHCRYLVATVSPPLPPVAQCPRCRGAMAPHLQTPAPAPALTTPATSEADHSFARRLHRDVDATQTPSPAPPPQAPARHALIQTDPPVASLSEAADAAPPQDVADVADVADADAPSAAQGLRPSLVPSAPLTAPAPADAVAGITPTHAPPPAPASREPAPARAPSFVHRHAHPAPVPSRLPWIAVVGLALVLCLQVLLADRHRLAADAQWRPLLSVLCNALRCSLPPWREPTAFSMLERDVRPVAGVPDVLLARATFRNDAHWPQPWPVILLTLNDADGRPQGARALQPADYLPRDAAAVLQPGQSAQMALYLREPDPGVVAFSFDFR